MTKKKKMIGILLLYFFFTLGLTTDQVTRWLSAHTLSAVEHGVSYMATVEEDGGTRIVGVSINVIKTPDFDPPGIMDYVDKVRGQSPIREEIDTYLVTSVFIMPFRKLSQICGKSLDS